MCKVEEIKRRERAVVELTKPKEISPNYNINIFEKAAFAYMVD